MWRYDRAARVMAAVRISAGVLLAGLLMAGCQSARPPAGEAAPSQPSQPSQVPAQEAASYAGYRVDPQVSEVRVLVYRAGALARLGHNHVMVAPVHGEVRVGASAAQSGFRLEIEAEALQVDPPAARADEGEAFASIITAEGRDGTRANMLGERVLDAARHPRIVIESVALSGPRWNPDVQANVTLRGTTSTVGFPAAVVQCGDSLTIVARLSLRLSDFAIEPFTALGGALQVQDHLDVRVRLIAVHGSADDVPHEP